eukprot:14241944-Alexandrium_andersonii.AAC.1
MSASLVGSEMCIRDRSRGRRRGAARGRCRRPCIAHRGAGGAIAGRHGPVSYTHLTLPTICSV